MKRIFLFIFSVLIFGLYSSAEIVKASYPGGDEAMQKYIAEKRIYPQISKDNGIEGIVVVAFTVKTDGSIGTIKIVRMIDPDLEQESIRLVKGMPNWNPATDNGKPVDSQVQIDIPFILEQ